MAPVVAGRQAWTCVVLAMSVAWAGCVAGDAKTLSEPSASSAVNPGAPESLAPAPSTISGIVTDPELLPIVGVDIVIQPGDLVLQTDDAGSFRTQPLSSGAYTIHAEKKGYTSVDSKVDVVEDKAATLRLLLEPMAADVPYHETLTEAMYLVCHLVIRHSDTGAQVLNAPCGGIVDLGTGSTNTLDHWIFFFKIDKPGFQSLAMEMTWNPQQFGHDGLMQLTTLGTLAAAENAGAATVGGTVYGGTQGPPFHDVIHAGINYWDPEDPASTFYPEPNATEEFKMLIAGGGDNTTFQGSAVFIEFRPTAYLTMFYNRQASDDFSILPDE